MHQVALIKWQLPKQENQTSSDQATEEILNNLWDLRKPQTLLWANDFQFLSTVLSKGNHPQHTKSIGSIADNNGQQEGRSRAVNSGKMGVWGMRKTHQNSSWTASASIWHSKITQSTEKQGSERILQHLRCKRKQDLNARCFQSVQGSSSIEMDKLYLQLAWVFTEHSLILQWNTISWMGKTLKYEEIIPAKVILMQGWDGSEGS